MPIMWHPQADADTVLGVTVEWICWHKSRSGFSLNLSKRDSLHDNGKIAKPYGLFLDGAKTHRSAGSLLSLAYQSWSLSMATAPWLSAQSMKPSGAFRTPYILANVTAPICCHLVWLKSVFRRS